MRVNDDRLERRRAGIAQEQQSGLARSSGELAWYVYGVIQAADSDPGFQVTGVDPSHDIAVLGEGPVAAVSSHVPLAEFEETRLRQHLGDIEWVEATARAHEQALQAIRRQTTVIPMRMCTVYRGEDGLREMLRREARSLEEALAHLEGRTEWGVKALLGDPPPAPARETTTQSVDPTAGQSAAPGSGTAYLQRRLEERDREQRAAQTLEEACRETHARLDAVAADSVLLPAQAPGVSGRPGEMILNAAYLVDDDADEAFTRELEELQTRFAPLGIELELTGPWPSYNFIPGAIGAGG
jgi:Gas vesicle synthesis protein GvpL/GvpF